MSDRTGLSRGDRNRNARLARLRLLSHRGKAVAKRGLAAASSRAVTEMIKEGVLARQSGELVLVNPAAQ